MAQKNNSPDHSIAVIIGVLALVFGVTWLVKSQPWIFLLPWKYIRAVELGATLQIDLMNQVLGFDFISYDEKVSYVNNRMAIMFRGAAALLLLHALYYFKMSFQPAWSMEAYLDGIYSRFSWLEVVYHSPNGIGFIRKFPFITVDLKHHYPDVEFPIGVEPMDYYAKFEDSLPDELKSQIGPALKIQDRKIAWTDKYAEAVAHECFRRIPNKKPSPEEKSWREQAWQRCVETHKFERTFALGMLQSARDFGVLNATEMLHIRRSAGRELKNGNSGTFYLWRAMISLGGRTAYAEGAGIICHYNFERALTEYLVTNPSDRQIVSFMRKKPWVNNAVSSFSAVRDVIMKSPDVIALKQAGLLK
jgi:hypothetical protein